jgi:hypothetical protein
MASAYLDCAAWADWPRDENGDEEGDSWARQAFESAEATVRLFLLAESVDDGPTGHDILTGHGIDPESAGHDLWLTRNRHGAGFWDRGYPSGVGDVLTAMAHAMGSDDVYIGDDGFAYLTGDV